MENILEIKNLSVSFNTFLGEVEAVKDVSIALKKGEILAIVGESGSGKSVTANSIIKLLPKETAVYKNGEIIFHGKDMLKLSEKEMNQHRGKDIAMVFQDPMTSLNPTMKVGKQIMEGLIKHSKVSKKEAYDRALEIMKSVSIPKPEKRMNQYPHEFSGGMRQRVMIAIAMVSSPELLIADEPTTALDVTVQAQILDLMKHFNKTLNTSIIFITHDFGVVADLADRVVVMYNGSIVEKGDVYEIFKNPKHDYTKKLLKAVPRLDMDKNERLYSIGHSLT